MVLNVRSCLHLTVEKEPTFFPSVLSSHRTTFFHSNSLVRHFLIMFLSIWSAKENDLEKYVGLKPLPMPRFVLRDQGRSLNREICSWETADSSLISAPLLKIYWESIGVWHICSPPRNHSWAPPPRWAEHHQHSTSTTWLRGTFSWGV